MDDMDLLADYEPAGAPLPPLDDPMGDHYPAWDPGEGEDPADWVDEMGFPLEGDDDAPGADDDADLSVNDYSDISNALRYARWYGGDLRFVGGRGWYVWDGKRWEEDRRRRSFYLSMRAVSQMEAQAPDPDTLKAVKQAKSVRRLDAMVKAASSLPELSCDPVQLDTHPMLLNVGNGVLDLATGKLSAHDRDLMITKLVAVDYDPDATAPRWERFIDEITCGDAELAAYLQRCIGYSLTGDVSESCLFVLEGIGANGKSVLIEVLQKLLGDSSATLMPDVLLAAHGDKPTTGLLDLRGARVGFTIETDEGRRWDEATLKQATGGDMLTARRMRQDPESWFPTHKLWVATNHRPQVRSTDEGVWRRMRILPMLAHFPVGKRDPHLKEKLLTEAAGILAWAVRGCLEWQKSGLGSCAAVDQATSDYRAEMDHLGAFLGEAVVDGPDAYVLVEDLWMSYKQWAADSGERYQHSKRLLTNALKDRGWTTGKRTGRRVNAWLGHGLNQEFQPRHF